MVVIAIIGILVAIITPSAFRAVEKAKVSRMVADVRAIKAAGYAYYADTGNWPKVGQDSYAPRTDDDYGFRYFVEADGSGGWNGPYLKKPLGTTPWGGHYRYWNSKINGQVRDAAGNQIPVNNIECAV